MQKKILLQVDDHDFTNKKIRNEIQKQEKRGKKTMQQQYLS